MAKAYKCDRCGMLIDEDKHKNVNALLFAEKIYVVRNVYSSLDEYDLCNDCAFSLIEWWNVFKTKEMKDANNE